MKRRRKALADRLACELRRATPSRIGRLSRWRQARLERQLGQIDHGQILRAYYRG